jgi:hypothetical protein
MSQKQELFKEKTMNRIQKQSWLIVITQGIGFLSAAIAVTVLYYKIGFPRAWAGLAFLGICGFGGLAPVLFRKDPGPVQFDERDRQIQFESARAGFAISYLFFGLLAMGIWVYCRRHTMAVVSINVLPMIWMLAGITMSFFFSLNTLILYGRDKTFKGETK